MGKEGGGGVGGVVPPLVGGRGDDGGSTAGRVRCETLRIATMRVDLLRVQLVPTLQVRGEGGDTDGRRVDSCRLKHRLENIMVRLKMNMLLILKNTMFIQNTQ